MNPKRIVLLLLAMTLIQCTKEKQTKLTTLFVGTYTETKSEGIYKLQFDSDKGEILSTALAARITNPSYLTVSKDHDFLYAVQEVDDFKDGAGAVTTFSMSNDTLIELQTVSSEGAHPCYVALSPKGDRLAVANYTGGNARVFDVEKDGKLTDPSASMNHYEIDTTKTAHAHMAQWVNDKLYIADLGLDAVFAYEGGVTGKAVPSGTLQLPKGAGPRHFTTIEQGRFLYVINELNSTITLFIQKDSGKYVGMQKVSTLAPDFEGESFCADIHVSPDGNFLYGSNRGENTIIIFKIDPYSGSLKLIGRESVRGDWPRNFTIDPTGKFLLIANQKSDNITVFKRDLEKGTLTYLYEQKLPKPVCLVFL